MAKDDRSSFSAILYHALTDSEQCSVLIEHPKFRNRAMLICREIAGPNRVEDLFEDACLRVLRYANSLDPDPLETEEKFFQWFTAVARHVHLHEKQTITDRKTCTESARHWPDLSRDVAEAEMDDFLDHTERCAYHEEILALEDQEDEKEMRSIFRLARGLDPHGRVLTGASLDVAIAEHERRMKFWKATTTSAKFPFSHIALYNGDKEIASCGKFFDLSKHESINELDPQAGIQIRGIKTKDESEHVLLGYYPLSGVRHESDEQLLPLDNGYTVGLTINRLSEKIFRVRFRCVESKVIENDPSIIADGIGRKALGMAAKAGGSSSSNTRYSASPVQKPDHVLCPLVSGRAVLKRRNPAALQLLSRFWNPVIRAKRYLQRLFVTPFTLRDVVAWPALVILAVMLFMASQLSRPYSSMSPHQLTRMSIAFGLREQAEPASESHPSDSYNREPADHLAIIDASFRVPEKKSDARSLATTVQEADYQDLLNRVLTVYEVNSRLSGKLTFRGRDLPIYQNEPERLNVFGLNGKFDRFPVRLVRNKAVYSEPEFDSPSCPFPRATKLASSTSEEYGVCGSAGNGPSLRLQLRDDARNRLLKPFESQPRVVVANTTVTSYLVRLAATILPRTMLGDDIVEARSRDRFKSADATASLALSDGYLSGLDFAAHQQLSPLRRRDAGTVCSPR